MAGASDLYQSLGGTAACRRLSTAFYARVAKDPILRPLFPGKTLHCAIEEFAAFLAQFLGGPGEDAQRRWWVSLRESHLRFRIGRKERDAWMSNMVHALDDAEIGEPMRGALHGLFERSSAYVVNQGPPPDPPPRVTHHEMARRWEAQQALDQAVAAIRNGDADGAIALAESSRLRSWFERDRAVLAALLAMMVRHGAPLAYVEEKLRHDPALATVRYSGRTLLHAAAAAGALTTVELLLRLGADPNVADAGGHTPLYSVGNECVADSAGDVVRALVQSGANVDGSDGVKHCTALHMAARRGNVDVARALLDCGADIEARDSLGETPLRRSVNCGKTEVASLLLSRGADPDSMGSKGLTPRLAARTGAMKLVFARRKE